MRNMIKIDILSPVGGLYGGIENVILQWTKNIDSARFDLRIVHMEPGRKYLEGYPKAYSFPGNNGIRGVEALEYYVNTYGGFISEHGAPDVCIATNWPVMVVAASIVNSKLGNPFKIVSWLHSKIDEYHRAGLGGVAHLKYADAHLVINNATGNIIKKYYPDADVYNIGNPVNMQKFVEKISGENIIAYVGRLSEIKRVDIILEALCRTKSNWKLIIIGAGEEEEELRNITEGLNLQDKVTFLGWQNNPWEFCNDVVALVAASEYEGFMLSAAEALSVGMMVISSAVDGVVDYIKPGVNGYLYQYEDAAMLAQILDFIDAGQLPVCDRRVCRESVGQYSIDNYFIKVEKILEEIFLCKKIRED